MQSSTKLSEADIQDIASFIGEGFRDRYGTSTDREIELLAKRFGVPEKETYKHGSLTSKRIYGFLQYLNDKSQLMEFLNHILEKSFDSKHAGLKKCNKILAKYGFLIAVENRTFGIVPIHSGLLEKERETAVSWIENHANKIVLSHLKDAKTNLGNARYDYVLDDCRKALEALTNCTVGFSDSIAELVKQNVILQGDKNRKMDAELIRVLYGYCSTFGAHASATGMKPDFEQAVLGLHLTESCIYFLLKRLEVKNSGKTLQRWS